MVRRHAYRRRDRIVTTEEARRRRYWFSGRLFVDVREVPTVWMSAPGDPSVFPRSESMSLDEFVAMGGRFVAPTDCPF